MLNLAFELQNDKDLREGRLFKPFEMVSLWDMLRISAEPFVNVCLRLGGSCGTLFVLSETDIPYYKDSVEQELGNQLGLEKLGTDFRILELPLSAIAAERLVRFLAENPSATTKEVLYELKEVILRFKDELKGRSFLMIPSSRAPYYAMKGTFVGQEIIDKIGHIKEDAEEAGNCFAVGRYTACVFHLGRLVERCLQDFGAKTGISLEVVIHMQWQEIINKIRSKLNEVWPKHNNPNRQPYENLLGHLETIKDAWRVPAVHAKMTYTDKQAEDVMNGVKAFVRGYVELLPHLAHLSASEPKSSS